jgi:hypothetical protein
VLGGHLHGKVTAVVFSLQAESDIIFDITFDSYLLVLPCFNQIFCYSFL